MKDEELYNTSRVFMVWLHSAIPVNGSLTTQNCFFIYNVYIYCIYILVLLKISVFSPDEHTYTAHIGSTVRDVVTELEANESSKQCQERDYTLQSPPFKGFVSLEK